MLTKLSAVNAMLLAAKIAPVNTLNEPRPEEVGVAVSTLERVSTEVQLPGWSFNTETNYTLTKDTDGYITFPSNAVRFKVDMSSLQNKADPVLRGQRLYDRYNQTFVWTANVKLIKLVRILEWDEIPETARHYIALKAARVYLSHITGRDVMPASMEEAEAFKTFSHDFTDTRRPNVFNNAEMSLVADRRSMYFPG
jgi:hypothetical protein